MVNNQEKQSNLYPAFSIYPVLQGNHTVDVEKFLFIQVCATINDGMIALDYHHFKTSKEIINLGNDHANDQWLLTIQKEKHPILWQEEKSWGIQVNYSRPEGGKKRQGEPIPNQLTEAHAETNKRLLTFLNVCWNFDSTLFQLLSRKNSQPPHTTASCLRMNFPDCCPQPIQKQQTLLPYHTPIPELPRFTYSPSLI